MGSGVSSDKAAYHHRGVSNVPVSVGPVHQILVRNGLRSLILSLTAGKVNKSKTYPVNDDIYCSDLKAANTEVPHPIKDASHNVPQLEIPIVSEVPIVRHARNSGMRASAVMMAKLIHDTVPEYKSYTEEEPSADELAMANRVRLLLSAPSKYLEFYTTVYEILYDSSAMRSFPIRTITFKNTFLSELMKLIVTAEDNSKTSFAEKVQYFGTKYKNEGIEVMECKIFALWYPLFLFSSHHSKCILFNFLLASDGQFGQAIVTAMRKVEKQDQNLWPKVYSRFLRTLVPYMIIQTSKSIMEVSVHLRI